MSQLTPAFVDVASQSPLIFIGVVVRRDTLSHLTTVLVKCTHKSPEPIGPLDTVLVIGDTLPVGRAALFFAVGMAAGPVLVVREASQMSFGPTECPLVNGLVALADSVSTNAAIAKSAATSDAVVMGTVASTRAITLTDAARGRLGEHAPRWREANVLVTQALRNADHALIGTQVRVLYAAGSDEADQASARLAPGDTRVLVLRWGSRVAPGARHGLDVSGRYFVFNGLDVRPASDSTRVARLIQ